MSEHDSTTVDWTGGPNTTPTLPVTGALEVALTSITPLVEQALTQGYVDADLRGKLLDVLKALAPILGAVIPGL